MRQFDFSVLELAGEFSSANARSKVPRNPSDVLRQSIEWLIAENDLQAIVLCGSKRVWVNQIKSGIPKAPTVIAPGDWLLYKNEVMKLAMAGFETIVATRRSPAELDSYFVRSGYDHRQPIGTQALYQWNPDGLERGLLLAHDLAATSAICPGHDGDPVYVVGLQAQQSA